MPSVEQILSFCKKKYKETNYAYQNMDDPNDNGYGNFLSGLECAFKQVIDFIEE